MPRLCLLLAFPMILAIPARAAQDNPFEVLGIGGAGGIFGCAASPVDPDFMLVSCDMSGCYRSYDGGRHWQLIPWQQITASAGDAQCRPWFHPTDENIAVWRSWITFDKGLTWERLAGGDLPWGSEHAPRYVAGSSAADPDVYVGTPDGLWGSHDGRRTWRKLADGNCVGIQVVSDGTAYAAVGAALYRWQAGESWPTEIAAPGVSGAFRALAVGATPAEHAIHIAAGDGVHTSRDSGRTFELTRRATDMADVVMALNQADVAYACNRDEVFVTHDGGSSWKSTFHLGENAPRSWIQRDMYWGYYVVPKGLGCGQGTPGLVMMSTQAELFISRDYGETWDFCQGRETGPMPGGGTRVESSGLEVTSAWCYAIDPREPIRHYAGFSDFGFIRSIDEGKTWSWAARGCPWANTFYDVEFDPFEKGRMYAATSRKHELITWIGCDDRDSPGGVCVSDDHAATWRPVQDGGLPVLPCTSIEIDRKDSQPGAVVLYASFWGKGVYKSVDSGRTWQFKPGVGRPGNYSAYMLYIHPLTNDLYCNVSANRSGRDFPVAGGLWRSSDGGDTWVDLTERLGIKWLNGYAVHPQDSDVVFVTGAATPADRQGGCYRTTDGGRTWRHVLTDAQMGVSYSHGLSVHFRPDAPDTVYFCGTAGTWISRDCGESWQRAEEIPFEHNHGMAFDLRGEGRMYICTGGAAILRGPVL